MGKYIRKFNEIGISDVASVGGKNASLGEMFNQLSSKGIRVPDGFATTAFAFQTFLESNQIDGELKKILSELDTNDFSNLIHIGKRARALISAAKIPKEISNEIIQSYHDLCSGIPSAVAVRSSATAEDLPNASFAGQHESFLNIKGDEAVVEAVHQCFASLYTARAIKYREDNGFRHEKVLLSVGVQNMVRSDKACSGVGFTLEPESGFYDVIHLAGVWGLGENIVQGTVTPDEFYIFKPTLRKGKNAIIQKKLGSKLQTMIYAEEDSQASTINLETPEEKRNQFVLNDQEILELANWSLMIEEHYDKPMDIEWARDGLTNELFIIQARPETVHSLKSRAIIEEYKLNKKGTLLASGSAIGGKIATGKARVLQSPAEADRLRANEIVVTDITSPDWDPVLKRTSAIITNKGGRTSHASIVAREQGMPAIVGCKNATTSIKDGQEITVSCSEGSIGYVYEGLLPFTRNEIDISKFKKPDTTKVMLILADPDQAFKTSFYPNDGVGLLRLEFIITHSIQTHPMALVNFDLLKDESDKQKIIQITRGYQDKKDFFIDKLSQGVGTIAAAFYPKDVIVRMSDFKTNEYANLIGGKQFEPEEENPMLGFRGASRYYSDLYKEGFQLECEAIKKVREEMGLTNVKVMIPFCRTIEEGKKVVNLMEDFGLDRKKDPSLQIYVMAEIPSNVLLAEEFAEFFDGFSIGSNDLTQLTLGIDRDSTMIADIFDEQNEAPKKMISMVIQKARLCGKPIGLCGQAPSDLPEFAQFLVKEGISSISFNADALLKGIENINEAEKSLLTIRSNTIISPYEIVRIIEERFRMINKFFRKIRKQFNQEDLDTFLGEIKKLRAFLRLLYAGRNIEKRLIPKQLKTIYGYIGIIRNLQMNEHSFSKFFIENEMEAPTGYSKIMHEEKEFWEKKFFETTVDDEFKESLTEILKSLPTRPDQQDLKNFTEKKLDQLDEYFETRLELIDPIRRIFQDILFTWDFSSPHLPEPIREIQIFQQLNFQLKEFRDKCLCIEFLSNEYLDKLSDKDEKNNLLFMREKLLNDKQVISDKLAQHLSDVLAAIKQPLCLPL